MKLSRFSTVAGAAIIALAAGACTERQERAGAGAALGAGTGALIGGLATGRAGGAVAGGLIGATGGAILADATRPRQECVRVKVDSAGNRICTRWRLLD